jgi:lipopolysaccharide heptosyltransferase I
MNFSRTLIIKPSSMGDIVQALPVLTALKEQHPRARIWWLVAKPFAGLLEGHPRLDGLILFDRDRFAQMARRAGVVLEFLEFLKDLRRRRFTTVLDLQGLLRSGVLALATGAPNRIGFGSARELAPLFYTAQVRLPRREMHAVERYLAAARQVGLGPPQSTDHLPVTEESRRRARERLQAEGLWRGEAFLVVGAHARWESKQWPGDRFAQVAERLWREAHARSVVIGGRDASPSARQVLQAAAALGLSGPSLPLDLAGKTTLKESVAIIAEARAMVTNDSGPMHIAAAVGTPVVAIFGPTHPKRTGPWDDPRRTRNRLIAGRAPCSPCYRRQCLLGGTDALRCLRNVSAAEVADLVLDRWRAA